MALKGVVMDDALKILIVDDSPDDVRSIVRTLEKGGLKVDAHSVHTQENFQQKLAQHWHIIMLDYHIPRVDTAALLIGLGRSEVDTPVIVVSGQVEMEKAVELMRLGARDFIRKDDLSRLVPCVQRELKEAELRLERKQALFDLHEARDQAEQASQAKSDFLLMLNHELRTPLHGMMGVLDLLLTDMQGMTAKQREYIRMSRMTADGMRELISDMLDLSKLEVGKTELNHESFDLKACLQSSMTPFFVVARDKGLALDLDLDNVPARIISDRRHLHQMLANLVGNAVKFTDQGSITLHVSVVNEQGIEQLKIDVRDTGIGIAETDLSSLFEPFVQCYTSDTQRPRGTGLGTTLVKRLSALLGGRVEVHAELGKGSCFTLVLPLHRDGKGEVNDCIRLQDLQFPNQEVDVKKVENLTTQRILIAEDDEISQRMMVASFSRAGVLVDCANHGLAAWNKLQKRHYDILLTDLRMPGLDGLELTRRIRSYEQQQGLSPLTIIGLSAHTLKEVKEECMAVGMNEFISKPVDAAQVIDIIQAESVMRLQ